MNAAPRNSSSLISTPSAALEDPGQLSEEAEKAVSAFFHEGFSHNSARTYKTALRYWGAWHALRFGEAIAPPVAPVVIIQFVADHLQHQPGVPAPEVTPYARSSKSTQHRLPLVMDRLLVERGFKAKTGPWTMATVQTRLAALSQAHEHFIAGSAHLNLGPEMNPLRDPRVRQFISEARRLSEQRGREPSRPVAATRQVMDALLFTCGDNLIGRRDRALLLFGWASGGRRRSEIVAATFENVRRDGEGFVYDLGRTKTRQRRANDRRSLKPIQGAAAKALALWIESLLQFRITHGPIFRRILNERIVEPLKDGAVREIIRRRARMANDPLGKLSAHSLRSGFLTEAGRQGISLSETMAMSGLSSAQTVMRYYQNENRTPRSIDLGE